jgi:hypothetical protein
MSDYDVENANIDSAIDAYLQLSEANLPEAGASRRERFQWCYQDNPDGRGNFFLLLHDNEGSQNRQVVGCVGIAPRRLRYRGTWLRAGLSADFAVDRSHRTVLPALRLQRAADAFGQSQYDLLYGFPNASAVGVFVRVGYKVVGHMGRYVKALRFAPFVHKRLPVKAISAPVGFVLDTFERLIERVRVGRLPSSLRFEWIEEFDARFDKFWNQSPDGVSGLVGYRSREWLQWRFKAYSRLLIGAIIDTATGDVSAYAVVAPKTPDVARISDFAAAGPGQLGALLACLPSRLRELGYHSASVQVLGPKWIGEVLERHQFRFHGPDRPVIARLPARNGATPPAPEDCYLTTADTDT